MPNKYHLTQSLLASWQYALTLDDGYERFLRALKREKEPPTQAMLDGVEFENCVNNVLNGAYIDPTHKWYQGIMEVAKKLKGSQQQVRIKKDILVDGVCFELDGILDFLRAGEIYDTKFSTHYYLNKYFDSPQHPMYFYLVPEATKFQYVSCDGRFVYTETYYPEDTPPIEVKIKQFMQFLDRTHNVDTFCDIWNLKTYYNSFNKKGNE